MNRRPSIAGAFTLLEVLFAMATTAVLAGVLYTSLSIAFSSHDSARKSIEPARRLALAIELLREDIESAMIPKGILAGQFVAQDDYDPSGNDSDTLTLHCTTWEPAGDQNKGDVKRVEILCEQSADSAANVLVRRTTTNLLSPSTVEPEQEVICRDVFAFNLRYFDGYDWQDNWDSGAQDNALPSAVEVTVQLISDKPEQQAEGGYRISRVFLVPCGYVADDMMELPEIRP
jgi:type II secretion system protein J